MNPKHRRGYSLIELIVGLVIAAALTASVGYVATAVLLDSKTRSSFALLAGARVEAERVKALHNGTAPENLAALMRNAGGIAYTAGASTDSATISVWSDGQGMVAYASIDDGGCAAIVDGGQGVSYAHDPQAVTCAASSVGAMAATITGTLDSPSQVDLG